MLYKEIYNNAIFVYLFIYLILLENKQAHKQKKTIHTTFTICPRISPNALACIGVVTIHTASMNTWRTVAIIDICHGEILKKNN